MFKEQGILASNGADQQHGEPVVKVQHIKMTFSGENGTLNALENVSFNLYPQEFVCLLGPSGCGKSTLLRILAGLLKPTSGEVIYPGKDRPNISLVFQDANLMPWRTVLQNITLPLELQGVPPAEARQRGQEWIEQVGLTGFADAWPSELSGGMAQRVAIARSLIQNPDLLLLDEPFGALDALTREKMGAELMDLWQSRRNTVLMVTHSIAEALLLSDRVLVMTPRPGKISLDLSVDIPRPRSDEIRYTEHFGALSRQLKEAIR